MKTSQIFINLLAMILLSLAGFAFADEITKEGYLTDSRGNVVRNSYNGCWHTGFWTPAMAIAECDPDLVKKDVSRKEAQAPAAVAPVAVPVAPAAVPAAVSDKPAFVPITLQTETLFDFDKAIIRADGKKILDGEVANKMKQYPQIKVLMLTAYADRIGGTDYNMKLSQRRADAVKAYLIGQGIAESRLETAAKGESEPVVSCSDVKGSETRKNKKLVECLQPNRRVAIAIKVQYNP